MTKKVMIDPGHAPGNANRGPTGYYEYWGMWIVSTCLKVALERCGVVADLTRKENENPSLQARGEAARGYDLFISEHSNAANGRVRGCEVYYSVRRSGDRQHAAAISAASAKLMDNPDRGAKTRLYPGRTDLDYYGVIRNAVAVGCPHVFLAESGFHDNPIDEAWLKNEDNLEKLAEVHAEEICKILGVKYIAPGADDEDSDVLYRVQVGAFAVKANADRMYHRLKADGYDTYMVQGDDDLYRVQTGAFRVRSNADRLANDLKSNGYDIYITTRAGRPVTPGKAEAPEPIRVGDKVRVKQGAKTYTGGNLASFVYQRVYDVIEVRGDRVVIGIGSAVTAAMNVNDLIKI
ncbi:MAG: N-acetylmuramoyl-L-alanine amidase [bacterium]|nr:N-acetylmuramoyl-L-alanine amidase [bacterium]